MRSRVFSRPSMPSAAPSSRFPLSPSSPSDIDLKIRPGSVRAYPAPDSPVSPSLMSVATKSYVSSYGNNQHTDEMAQRPSPRSNTENYVQHNQKPNSYQEGTLKRPNRDEEEQHRDKRQKLDVPRSDRMDVDSNITPTNHDRLGPTEDDPESARILKRKQTSRGDFDEPFLLSKSGKHFHGK